MLSPGRLRDGSTMLNVLTLNCWDLKLPRPFCRLRKERMEAIGNKLAEGDHQVVLLEELWVQADYDAICIKLFKVLPHSHYFHSGIFGSGLAIFSKFPILETLQHRFPVNGSPFRLIHGDWYTEKCVGLAQLWVNEMRIHVYITHTHSDYDGNPIYRYHRLVQAFELSQFIRNTSAGCDAVIVGGDFNSQPSEVFYNLVLANGNLLDAWTQQQAPLGNDTLGTTSGKPSNPFSKPSNLKALPHGKRIDYLLYRNNAGCDIICRKCQVVMETVPGSTFTYSDHSGLAAAFSIRKHPTVMAPERLTSAVTEIYAAAIPQLEDGINSCFNKRIYFILFSILSLISLLFLSNLHGGGYLSLVPGVNSMKNLLCLAIGICLWCTIVVSYREENALKSAKKDMQVQMKSGHL